MKINYKLEIHPCPICGAPMVVDHDGRGYWVYCYFCDLSRDLLYGTAIEAAVSWNKLFEKESESEE